MRCGNLKIATNVVLGACSNLSLSITVFAPGIVYANSITGLKWELLP